MPKPTSIDDYLASVPDPERAALLKLRKTLHSLLPGAEECISYSMPAFRYRGHVVAGFLATRRGCSYFPFSGATLATLASELRGYGQTKSALHFDAARPLPAALVKKLVSARVAELGESAREKRTAPRNSAKALKAKTAARSARGRAARAPSKKPPPGRGLKTKR
jgi:uncharacterized protein YdhG (YjbR/CyaY superfamily)